MNAEILQSPETKQRIIQNARKLFSKFGFEGTSVREIAKASEVNLAAVNYHFENKKNLYWQIISESYQEGERVCQGIFEASKTLEEFSIKVFDHFNSDKELMRNTMLMILSDTLTPPEGSALCTKMSESDSYGPPGGTYFAQLLIKEIKYPLRPEAIVWGVKSIFGNIVHWSTMCSTMHFASLAEKEPLMRPEQIRKDVQRMIHSTIDYIQNNPKLFQKG